MRNEFLYELIDYSILIDSPLEANSEDKGRIHFITERISYHVFKNIDEFEVKFFRKNILTGVQVRKWGDLLS